MKILRPFLLWCLSFLLCPSILAQAPTTAKIAFVSNDTSVPWPYESSIYMMNLDGSDLVNLIRSREGINQIAWEPTGERILFGFGRGNDHDIYIMNADGTDARPMFTKSRYRREPAWSPDGKRIAYIAWVQGVGWSIHIALTDGQPGEPILGVGRGGGQPAWSPDGTEIAFVAGTPGKREVYILNLEAHTQRRLLPEKERQWTVHPAWSPDGEKIAFTRSPWALGPQIFVANRDGTGLEQITELYGIGQILSIAWTPSGDAIVYGKRIENIPRLFKVHLNDRRNQQLTDGMPGSEATLFAPGTVVAVEPSTTLFITTWSKIKRRN